MKQIKFIAISDVHWNDWSNQFNQVDRLEVVHDLLAKIYNIAYKQNAAILLPGDLIHNPKQISNRTLQEVIKFHYCAKVETYAIDGNHDQSEQNTVTNRSPNWVSTLSQVIPSLHNVADKPQRLDGYTIWGIPYITGNKEFKEQLEELESNRKPEDLVNILLIHTDLPRAKDSSGYQIDTVNGIPANIGKFFKKWDLVLSGHIHMGQEMSSKILMIGAPYQQRRSDQNLIPGYWEIYNDMTFKFKKLDFAPVYKSGKLTNEFDFFTKKPKKMTRQNNGTTLKFDKDTNTEKLVDNYLEVINETSKKRKKLLNNLLK